MLSYIGGFLTAFFVGLIIVPLLLKILKKAKAKQTILHYVEAHKQKQGTPTLGGIVFLLAGTLAFFIFKNGASTLSLVALIVFLCFGFLGFLDDFIKIKTHKNLGLKPYQKLFGQTGIAVLVAVFVYKNLMLQGKIFLPVGFFEVDISWGIIPLVIFSFLAMTNSANLTDGLDGLAGGVSFVCLLTLGVVSILTMNFYENAGENVIVLQEQKNLALLSFCVAGGVLSFLCFNSYPAKIFMGDTGSLALGGILCAIATFCKQELLLILICVTFVLSAVSVLIQVIYFKKTKKRIFLMAPLHHHFEKKGVNETKIVAIYIITTIIASVISVALCLV